MAIGIITGFEIAKNKDGDNPRILLQVKMLDDDIRTVELVSQAGEDNNPASGCRVVVADVADSYKIGIAVTDDLAPECDPGEKELYSTSSPAAAKLARTKWDSAGNVVHNLGANSAVSFAALDAALQLLVTAINAAFATKLNGAGAAGGLALDISLSESPTVKIP